MSRNLEAIYENGVLRPLEPVDLQEHQRVTLTINATAEPGAEEGWLDHEYREACAREADDSIPLEAVRRALARIPGSLTADFSAERDER